MRILTLIPLLLLCACHTNEKERETPRPTTKKRVELEGRSALHDRKEWNKLSAKDQDLLIIGVAKKLGSAFKHVETKTYKCATVADCGISHRIATFEHLESGALLNLIPGGTFQMGSNEEDEEQPIHKVTIEPMLIGRYEVSQSVWDKIGGSDSRRHKGAKRPIGTVSWFEVKAWLKKAGSGLRLPSEAEWEYACRAGSAAAFCFGETVTPEQVNYDESKKTLDIGSLPCNAFGLHEVHGNIGEWCEDAWLEDYKTGPNSHLARNTEKPSKRVFRGGFWAAEAAGCRSACRYSDFPNYAFGGIGFRISKSID